MKLRFTRIAIWLVAILSISVAFCGHAAEQPAKGAKQQASPPAAKSAHRVVACYFHRTEGESWASMLLESRRHSGWAS